MLDVARALRLKVKYEDLEGCEGILIRPRGVSRGIIAVRKDIRSPGRKRFTIAHEIGHFVLASGDEGAICKSGDIESWDRDAKDKERQADDFAAELLIPATVVASRLSTATPSLRRIEMVADECGTSLTASAWRYCDLTTEPCAVVWSQEGKVSWSKRSPEFPFLIQKGRPIENESYASNCFRGESVPSRPELVPASAWIDSWNLKEGSKIYEESRALPSYGSVLTLLWIHGQVQNKTDYDEDEGDPLEPNNFTVYRKRWPK